MSITTKTGDLGQTRNFEGDRVSKADLTIELSGAFDAAQSAVGFAIVEARRAEQGGDADSSVANLRGCSVTHIAGVLVEQQRTLFACVGELADGERFDPDGRRMAALEDCTSKLNERVAPEGFVLPGGSELAARIDLARVAVRNCERTVVAARDGGLAVSPEILAYLNRLSDFLFLAARLANASLGVEETAV
ncbi:MAG: ATP:cob(I)alamin adenosyltransferase [Coriobacteriia bacterium]|nr:ATP:cob(I)alamin adenosyltransferase [Coriobacteriia bacterium]